MTWPDRIALALGVLFVVAASLWIDRPGIQTDEALFGVGVFQPEVTLYQAEASGHRVPLMLMSYMGALKTWIYAGIFRVWAPSPASIRIPMILCGGITMWLVYWLLKSTVSARAGLFGSALLVLDPSFLWTIRCDWGPVALQQLLTTGGVAALVRFGQTHGRAWLGTGFLCFGLALWNKAVVAWVLFGFLVATAVIIPRELPRRLSLTAVLVAALGFLAGCWPLIAFNVSRAGETVSQTGRFRPADIGKKIEPLIRNIDGEALIGYLMREKAVPGWPDSRSTRYSWLFAAGLPLLYWSRHRRVAVFFLTTAAATWLTMASTVDGGGSTHHIVLLWPWLHCFAAVVLVRLRLATGAAVVAIAMSSAGAVTVNYYRLLLHNGADPPWSEAIYELVKGAGPGPVGIYDWGITDSLSVLTGGRTKVVALPGPEVREERQHIERWIRNGERFASHVDGRERFTGINARVNELARSMGFERRIEATFADRQGNPIFQTIRFIRAASSAD